MNRQRLVPGHFRPAMMSRAAVGVTIGVAVRTGREALRQAVAAFDDLALQESVVGPPSAGDDARLLARSGHLRE